MIVTFADPEKPLSNQMLRFPDLEIHRFIWNTNTQPQEQQDQLIFELRKLVDASNIDTLVA